MTLELVPCPACLGDGWVWYEGTTPPTGDDPSSWVKCPVCQGKFLVRKDWADLYNSQVATKDFCAHCGKYTYVVEADITMGPVIFFGELTCLQCYEEYTP